MRIAVIGGLERHERQIAGRAARMGHGVEFHRGHVGGRHAEELEAIVHRCDLAIIVTQVNSHGAVQLAKKAAQRFARPSFIVRTCGASRFARIMDSLPKAANAASPVTSSCSQPLEVSFHDDCTSRSQDSWAGIGRPRPLLL